MARIAFGSYMIRYPLGGMLSWALQYFLGFHRLGHEVYLVEKANYPNACFDPSTGRMTDDCSFGARVVDGLLERFGLKDRWCFVDYRGEYHGMSKVGVGELFRTADLFVDGGTHGSWLDEASASGLRILIDGEPGYTQMKWENLRKEGRPIPEYDHYYTNGCLLGEEACRAPVAGRRWRPLFNPVLPDLFEIPPAEPTAPYTTVMNWQSRDPIDYGGRRYGQKDVEFLKFIDLPRRVSRPVEVAVAGKKVPLDELRAHRWRVRSAHDVTRTFDAYREYVAASRGEFGVCKNVFVDARTGWFSDRSAAYLAGGRPVVLQDTGFSDCLPCGEGLFAVGDVAEAAAAIEEIEGDYPRHARRATEIAREYLDAEKLLGRVMDELGFGEPPVAGRR